MCFVPGLRHNQKVDMGLDKLRMLSIVASSFIQLNFAGPQIITVSAPMLIACMATNYVSFIYFG